MRDSPSDILKLAEHTDFDLAVPTPDHFIPLLYIAALAATADDTPDVLVDGPAYGSISMISYTVGVTCPEQTSEQSYQSPVPRLQSSPTDLHDRYIDWFFDSGHRLRQAVDGVVSEVDRGPG